MSNKVVEDVPYGKILADEVSSDEDPAKDHLLNDKGQNRTYEQLLEQVKTLEEEKNQMMDEAKQQAVQHGLDLIAARDGARKRSDDDNKGVVELAMQIWEEKKEEAKVWEEKAKGWEKKAEKWKKKAEEEEKEKNDAKDNLKSAQAISAQQEIEIENLKAMVETLKNEKEAAELKGEEEKEQKEAILGNLPSLNQTALQHLFQTTVLPAIKTSFEATLEFAIKNPVKMPQEPTKRLAKRPRAASESQNLSPATPSPQEGPSNPSPPLAPTGMDDKESLEDGGEKMLQSDSDSLKNVVVPDGNPTEPAVLPRVNESKIPENSVGPDDNALVKKSSDEPPYKRFKTHSTGATPPSDRPSTTPPPSLQSSDAFSQYQRARSTSTPPSQQPSPVQSSSSSLSGTIPVVTKDPEDGGEAEEEEQIPIGALYDRETVRHIDTLANSSGFHQLFEGHFANYNACRDQKASEQSGDADEQQEQDAMEDDAEIAGEHSDGQDDDEYDNNVGDEEDEELVNEEEFDGSGDDEQAAGAPPADGSGDDEQAAGAPPADGSGDYEQAAGVPPVATLESPYAEKVKYMEWRIENQAKEIYSNPAMFGNLKCLWKKDGGKHQKVCNVQAINQLFTLGKEAWKTASEKDKAELTKIRNKLKYEHEFQKSIGLFEVEPVRQKHS